MLRYRTTYLPTYHSYVLKTLGRTLKNRTKQTKCRTLFSATLCKNPGVSKCRDKATFSPHYITPSPCFIPQNPVSSHWSSFYTVVHVLYPVHSPKSAVHFYNIYIVTKQISTDRNIRRWKNISRPTKLISRPTEIISTCKKFSITFVHYDFRYVTVFFSFFFFGGGGGAGGSRRGSKRGSKRGSRRGSRRGPDGGPEGGPDWGSTFCTVP